MTTQYDHLTEGELSQAAWAQLTEYLGEFHGLYPAQPRRDNPSTIARSLPSEVLWWHVGRDEEDVMAGLDKLTAARDLIDTEIDRVTRMVAEQNAAAFVR